VSTPWLPLNPDDLPMTADGPAHISTVPLCSQLYIIHHTFSIGQLCAQGGLICRLPGKECRATDAQAPINRRIMGFLSAFPSVVQGTEVVKAFPVLEYNAVSRT
jgi:hypothetical protein